MFERLPEKFSFPESEEKILAFWKEHDIFGKSLEQRRGQDAEQFVFYEGPPTANGMPHPGHCLTRAMKDLFPRYQTMCGKLVERKAGWDTHGLPVEVEVCKELGIHTKEEIEAYGLEKFVHKCVESVWRYTREWEYMTSRLGFWINLDEAYATYHQYYVESVWWSLKTLFERGLLYQGHKVVWWWAQGGTALSAGEVGEGYRTVDDPSVFVKFPLVDGYVLPGVPLEEMEVSKRCSLLIWTTTPWTLISNHFAAVNNNLEYALVEDPGNEGAEPEYLYIAKDLVETIAKKVKRELRLVGDPVKGSDLVKLRYFPPYKGYYDQELMRGVREGDRTHRLKNGDDAHVGWRVLPAEFVTLESGTGLVHEAPAYGEVDFDLLQSVRTEFVEPGTIRLLNAVAPNGAFTDEAPERYRGRWVKDCDKDIIRELRDERKTPWGTPLLFHQEVYRHDYPFCPRAEDDPLIQYARKSWFVRTSQFKQRFLDNNEQITWLPDHIKEGRFGDFLRNNVDWALSRERYWGTPLPIWVCEQTGKMEAIGSYDELLAKPGVTGTEVWDAAKALKPDLPDDLRVHKPYIDAVTYDSPFAEESGKAGRQEGTKGGEGEAPVDPGATGSLSARVDTGGQAASGTQPCGVPRMRRVKEVIDCWWDAGSMPFAQWGFPHVEGSLKKFSRSFPANFISEAIDQTRGWFYGQLAISTLLFTATKEQREAWFESFDKAARQGGGPSAEQVSMLRQAVDDPHCVISHISGADLGVLGGEKFKRWSIGPHPYQACIVLGHMMGEDGTKMSKRLKNYKDPGYMFDHLGADAMRWFFFSAQTPWTSVRFQENAIRDAQREFLVRLYNVFSFFNIYASIDGFAVGSDEATERRSHEGNGVGGRGAAGPGAADASGVPANGQPKGTGWRSVSERSELDRWIISEMHLTIRAVRASLDRFENFPAAQRLNEFVDALSNWYVRRSRDRFWRGIENPGMQNPQMSADSTGNHVASSQSVQSATSADDSSPDQEKWDAYNTLYETLTTLCRMIAPFTPFFAETMFQNLEGAKGPRDPGAQAESAGIVEPSAPRPLGPSTPVSVHLCDYPAADGELIDEALAGEMELVRDITSLGRSARTLAKIKVRQPLAQVEIILANHEHESWLAQHAPLIAEELNVKRVEFTSEADHYVHYQVKPNFKALGPKFGKLAPKIAKVLQTLPDAAAARKSLVADGQLTIDLDGQSIALGSDDVEIRLAAKEGWSAAQGRAGVVVLNTDVSDELKHEGLIRELIHHVQTLRKEQNLAYQARITLHVDTDDEFTAIVRQFESQLKQEVLADAVVFGASGDACASEIQIEGFEVRLAVLAGE